MSKITLDRVFCTVTNGLTHSKPRGKEATLPFKTAQTILATFQDGTYAKAINAIREAVAAGDGKRVDALKDKLPAVTFAGRFDNHRAKAGCTFYSGIVILDIDGKELPAIGLPKDYDVKTILANDPYTIAAFFGPSGNGGKALVRIGAPQEILDVQTGEVFADVVDVQDDHERAFAVLTAYYKSKYGLPLDPSGSNLDRLCFATYDPEIYVNEDAPPFDVEAFAHLIPPPAPPPAPKATTTTSTTSRRTQTAQDGLSPLDQYDAEATSETLADLLLSAGWMHNKGNLWTRPGKAAGRTSGEIVARPNEKPFLVCYTSGAPPLESFFAPGKTGVYWPARLLTTLKHNGNASAAAGDAAHQQGRTRKPAAQKAPTPAQKAPTPAQEARDEAQDEGKPNAAPPPQEGATDAQEAITVVEDVLVKDAKGSPVPSLTERVKAIWEDWLQAGDFPYFAKQSLPIPPLAKTARRFESRGKAYPVEGWLALPIYNYSKGSPVNILFISPDGTKRTLEEAPNGFVKVWTGDEIRTDRVLCADDLETALALAQVSGCMTLAPHRTKDIGITAKKADEFYPDAEIYVASQPPNAGAAHRAAKNVGAAVLDCPARGGMETRFLDLYRDGAQVLKDVVLEAFGQGLGTSGGIRARIPYDQTENHQAADVDFAVSALARLGWETPFIPNQEAYRIYAKGNMLVEISREESKGFVTYKTREIAKSGIRTALTRVVDWSVSKRNKFGEIYTVRENPGDKIIQAIADLEDEKYVGIKPLEGVSTIPILRPDGTLYTTPGYDAQTSRIYAPTVEVPPIPDAPTLEDARRAAALLLDWVEDFPFHQRGDVAAWMTYLLTLSARQAIPGPTPFFTFDAPTQGTGKGLLMRVSNIIASGGLPVLDGLEGKSPEELTKTTLSQLLNSTPSVVFDNVEGQYGNPVLNTIATEPTFGGRILGVSKYVNLPNTTVWAINGNNAAPVGDMTRRVIPVRLVAQTNRPDLRTDMRLTEMELERQTKARRGEFAAAALTILRAHAVAGRPCPIPRPFGSYSGWMSVIRDAVLWATGLDAMDSRARVEQTDERRTESESMLEALYTLIAEMTGKDGLAVQEVSVAEIIQECRNYAQIDYTQKMRDCFTAYWLSRDLKDGLPEVRSLGMRLAKLKGKIYEGHHLEQGMKGKTPVYSFKPLEPRVSLVSLVSFSTTPRDIDGNCIQRTDDTGTTDEGTYCERYPSIEGEPSGKDTKDTKDTRDQDPPAPTPNPWDEDEDAGWSPEDEDEDAI